VGGVSYLIGKVGLYFTSTSYDWLVVNSDTAWLQGTGNFNGMDGYTFLMTVTDNPDSFRLQIWEAGGTKVYDSHPDTPIYTTRLTSQ
jgi:large repetitive protein